MGRGMLCFSQSFRDLSFCLGPLGSPEDFLPIFHWLELSHMVPPPCKKLGNEVQHSAKGGEENMGTDRQALEVSDISRL